MLFATNTHADFGISVDTNYELLNTINVSQVTASVTSRGSLFVADHFILAPCPNTHNPPVAPIAANISAVVEVVVTIKLTP